MPFKGSTLSSHRPGPVIESSRSRSNNSCRPSSPPFGHQTIRSSVDRRLRGKSRTQRVPAVRRGVVAGPPEHPLEDSAHRIRVQALGTDAAVAIDSAEEKPFLCWTALASPSPPAPGSWRDGLPGQNHLLRYGDVSTVGRQDASRTAIPSVGSGDIR